MVLIYVFTFSRTNGKKTFIFPLKQIIFPFNEASFVWSCFIVPKWLVCWLWWTKMTIDNSSSFCQIHTHTHTHKHTHTQTHTHEHTHTRARKHAHTHIHIHTNTYTLSLFLIQKHTHTQQTNTLLHSIAHIHSHSRTNKQTHLSKNGLPSSICW